MDVMLLRNQRDREREREFVNVHDISVAAVLVMSDIMLRQE